MLAVNGPLAEPRGGVFLRYATLAWGQLPAGQKIGEAGAVFPRIELKEAVAKMRELEAIATAEQNIILGKNLTPDQIVAELYLLVYGRLPDVDEVEIGRRVFAEKDVTRRRATEDLMWALINTPEFIFKD